MLLGLALSEGLGGDAGWLQAACATTGDAGALKAPAVGRRSATRLLKIAGEPAPAGPPDSAQALKARGTEMQDGKAATPADKMRYAQSLHRGEATWPSRVDAFSNFGLAPPNV